MEEPIKSSAPLTTIVAQFAAKHERAPHEVETITNQLSTNWVNTLEHWQMLDVEAKKELGLPAVLVAHLDALASSFTASPSILPALLADLPQSHAPVRSSTRYGYCYYLVLRGRTYFWLGERTYEFGDADRMSSLLGRLEGSATFQDAAGSIIPPDTPLSSALLSNGRLVHGENVYLTRLFSSWKAVDHWLCSIGLSRHRETFEEEGIDDFLVLPFLRLASLEDMRISTEDKRTISLAVQTLQDCLPGDLVGMWMRHMGYANYMDKFIKHQIWPQLLLVLKEEDLRLIGVKTCDVPVLWELIRSYQQFSSVEASYLWLRSHGFENYAFQFVRYNIPFYALPLVNFFIIGEMAVLGDNQDLLRALQALKDSPAYNVKAVAFWLRDLELSNYTQTFAKNLMVNFIESLTILTDHTINRLVSTVVPDRNKLKTAVREMKEFRFYYLATASLLEEPIMQKHAQLFAEHGVSIDVLPLLTDTHIQEMGITDSADRVKILEALKKLRELPVTDKNSRLMATAGKKYSAGVSPKESSLSLNSSPTSPLEMKMSGIGGLGGLSTSPSSLSSLAALGGPSALDLRVTDMKLTPKPKRRPAKK